MTKYDLLMPDYSSILLREFVSNYDELCEYLDSIHSEYRCTADGGTAAMTTATTGVSSSKESASAAQQDSSPTGGGDGGGASKEPGAVDPAEAASSAVSHEGRGSTVMVQQRLQDRNGTNTVVFKHIHKGCLTV